MKKKVFLVINFIIIISIIMIETKYDTNLTYFDLKVSELVWSIRTPILTDIMKFISFLASTKFIIIVLLIYILIRKDIYLPLNMSISTIINQFLKRIIKRRRPINIIVKEKGFSFPSGHSMAAFSFYGYIIYKIYKTNYSKSIKIITITMCSLLILLVGFSRIYLGAHYLSDVISGFLISLEYLVIFISVTKI